MLADFFAELADFVAELLQHWSIPCHRSVDH
jgi:hypothetical protein